MRIIIIRRVIDAVPPAPEPSAADAAAAGAEPGPPRVESAALLGRSRELIIVHGGREYRLRVTQNGKLILTA
jgi:hemin uptake protein HemP